MDHGLRIVERWRIERNNALPHGSLSDMMPNEYARSLAERADRTVALTKDSTGVPEAI